MSDAGNFLFDVIHKTAGHIASNRRHALTYTENILRGNAHEIHTMLSVLENEEFMFELWRVENKPAKTQVHREMNRVMHNYVMSVATYADHIRAFMRRNYRGTPFFNQYEQEVKIRFSEDNFARFVRDLRNFMAHSGLPDSSFEMKMVPVKGSQADENGSFPCKVSFGFYYTKQGFYKYNKWSEGAKVFLRSADDHMYLHHFMPDHIDRMTNFLDWFDDAYAVHHEADFTEHDRLIEQYESMKSANE